MAIQLLALVVCLAGAAVAGPLQRDDVSQCSRQCPAASDEKFDYQPGNKYVYQYRGVDYVSVAGKRKEQRSQITAKVELYVIDRCEMALKLRDVQYQGEQELSDILVEQLATPLRFSWVDGKIEHICSSPEESQESENIKRGILSALVNTMPNLQEPSQHREVDSLGSCETKYTIIKSARGEFKIRKEKSLKSCDNRHSGLSAFPYNPYQSPQSKIQGLPIFTNEKSECHQEVRDRKIQKAKCTASAQIQPLSQYDSLVQFQGEIELQFQGVQRSSMPQQNSEMSKKDIRFNYDQEKDVESQERKAIEILEELCPKTEGLLHPSVSKHYLRLIMVLKGLPADKVENLYESLKRGEICQSPKTLDVFLDALPMAGTESTIKLMVRLLKTKQVSSLKAKVWPASFALIQNPNAEAISAVLPLVSEEEKSRPVLLGLSAMIYKICSKNDCDRIESVRSAVAALQRGLGPHCSSDNEAEVISILKAFGNMGYHGQAEETILQCAQSPEKPIGVRLAAIDAFRRYTKEIPSALIHLYSSPNEHFEIRIAALATAVQTPDSRLSAAIQQVMQQDQDEQVLAFTSSLVKNLKKSSSPLKQSIKQSLQEVQIDREVGYWENSKNIELSAFNVPTNLGASLESNIIHAQGTKIPRSVSSKLDIDIFGKNVNIFEFGARAEGLEKAAKRFLGMEQSNKQKRSWFTLSSSSSDEEDKPELSFYLRTMGTEFFDMTVSDFTSVGNMMQFADVVNKLSQGEKADFAHSFLFLNTKIIIPSVTGRSYAFGMTGSATVGLSADGKFDIINLMSSPRNCDVGGRIRPSANVEITTTLGIHSEKSRPDVKIVTSFHSEGDLGAKIRMKDSHMVEARLELPSEKIQLLKVSTELLEVDANDNETPIIQDMQTKVDHCVRSLEKPLGIQICGKFETPHPFVSRNFPYARGLGNLELAIRKSESSMKGYVMSFEMPKRRSEHMTYRFIMDTPGSSVQRKFQINLDLTKTPSGEREFKLDAQSPFKDISTSGSYTWQPNLVQGALNVITDKSRRYSMKAVVETSGSGSEMTMKPTVQWTWPESEPVSVSGSIVYSNRRKQHLMIDLRSNKQGVKPYVLSGNLMKEGQFGVSRSDQWKMSGDLVAKSPYLTTKIHSTVDKQPGQSQGISSAFSVDYETEKSRKQSIKFSSKLQQSSSKVSASAQFETTRSPKFNWQLNWDMQGKAKDALKNDIMLRYGRNPERTYIQISQSCQIGDENSLSEGRIALKIPQVSIDSELKVALTLQARKTGNYHIESDLRYASDRHVKLLLQLKHLSKRPVKIAVKAQLEYPGRKLMYKDEIEETSAHVYEGRSILQWQADQQASLQYQYKKLSDLSIWHHEIKSTLRAPFMRSGMTSQASMRATKESLEIKAQAETAERSNYKFQAQLNRRGQSHLTVSSPAVDGQIEITNEPEQKSAKLNAQVKSRYPQRISAAAAVSLSHRKSLSAEMGWNADQYPSQKIAFSTEFESGSQRSQKSYSALCSVQVLDRVVVEASYSGDRSSQSYSHQTKLEVSGRRFQKVTVQTHHELTPESIRSTLSYKKADREKAVAEISGKYVKHSGRFEMQTSASVKSPDHSFEDKELFVRHSYQKIRSSTNLQSIAQFEYAPGKKYGASAEYSSEERQSRKLKIAVETPHKGFSHQEISLAHRKEPGKNTVNVAVQCSGKEIALASELAKTQYGGSIKCSLETPFQIARDITMLSSFENQRTQKQFRSQIEVNQHRKFETACSYSSSQRQQTVQANVKLQLESEYAVKVEAEKNQGLLSHEVQATKDSSKIFSYKISHRSSGDNFNCQLEAESSQKSLVDIKLMKETTESNHKYTLKINKPFTPVSVVVQATKIDGESRNVMINACRESSERLCYDIKGYYKREYDSDKYDKYRKITLDIQKVIAHNPEQRLCNVHYLLSKKGLETKSKFILEAQDKRYGYEFTMKRRSHEDKPCELDASLIVPARTVRTTISAIHNPQRSAYEIMVIPKTSSPTHKIVFEVKRNWNSRDNQLSGQFRFVHPALQKPISAKYNLHGTFRQPESVKFDLDYLQNPQNKLTIEVSSKSSRNQPEKKAYVCKVYTAGKDLDLTVSGSAHQTHHMDTYSYEWTLQTKRGVDKGEATLQLSDKVSGRPRTVEFKYSCPHAEYTVLSRRDEPDARFPSKVDVKLTSNHETTEMQYQHGDSCTSVEVKRSAPVWKSRVCMNKAEEGKLTLLSVESFCQDSKCMDMRIDLDPSLSHVANIGIKWRKEQFQRTLQSLKDMSPVLHTPYQKHMKELIQNAELLYSPVKEQILQPLLAHIREEIRQISSEQAEQVQQIKTYLQRLTQQVLRKVPDLPTCDEIRQKLEQLIQWVQEDGMKYFDEYAPEWLKEQVHSLLETATECLKHYCERGTFCYQLKQAYQRRGLQQVEHLLKATFNQKMEQLQAVKKQKMSAVKDWISDAWRTVTEWIGTWKERFESIIPSVKESAIVQNLTRKTEEIRKYFERKANEYFEKAIEIVDQLLDHARKNEDFRVLTSLLQDAKHEILRLCQQMNLQQTLQPLSKTFLVQYPQNWLHEKINVSNFDMKRGNVQIQLHHPLDESKVQLLKNVLVMAKNKYQSYMN